MDMGELLPLSTPTAGASLTESRDEISEVVTEEETSSVIREIQVHRARIIRLGGAIRELTPPSDPGDYSSDSF